MIGEYRKIEGTPKPRGSCGLAIRTVGLQSDSLTFCESISVARRITRVLSVRIEGVDRVYMGITKKGLLKRRVVATFLTHFRVVPCRLRKRRRQICAA
jgi:hypothetical protein